MIVYRKMPSLAGMIYLRTLLLENVPFAFLFGAVPFPCDRVRRSRCRSWGLYKIGVEIFFSPLELCSSLGRQFWRSDGLRFFFDDLCYILKFGVGEWKLFDSSLKIGGVKTGGVKARGVTDGVAVPGGLVGAAGDLAGFVVNDAF